MAQGSLQLAWAPKEREDTLLSGLGSLQKSSEYSDVTLVSEDGKQLRAHRAVVAACSSALKKVFANSSELNNMNLYMYGMKYIDLAAILDFMYQGKAMVDMESLESFMRAAKELKVVGLADMDMGVEESDKEVEKKPLDSTKMPKKTKKVPRTEEFNCSICTFSCKKESNLTKHISIEHNSDYLHDMNQDNEVNTTDKDNLDHNVVASESLEEDTSTQQDFICTHCGFICNSEHVMKNHEKENHANLSAKYRCCEFGELCDFGTESKGSLKQHEKDVHGIIRVCSKCDFKATSEAEYQRHLRSSHRVKSMNVFPCPECEYKAKTQENLDRHIEFIVHRPKVDI